MAKAKKGELVDAAAVAKQRIGEYVDLHSQAKMKGAEFVWAAITCGMFARAVKEGLRHGEFKAWLEEASEMKHGPSVRTSQTYMAAAKRAEMLGLKSKNEVAALLGDEATLKDLTGSVKNSLPAAGERSPDGGGNESNGIGLRLASVLSGEETQVKRLSDVAVEYPDFGQSKEYDTIIRSRKTIMNKLRSLIGDDE